MRFKQFITEQKFNLDKFFKECEPYLTEITGIDRSHLAKHGTRTAPNQWEIVEFQPRMGPRDSQRRLHDEVNAFFKEKFDWAARSHALFVTGDYEQAKTYGPTTLVFPIGKIQTLWSPDVYDMYHVYSDAKDQLRRRGKPGLEDTIINDAVDITIESIKESTWYFNRRLKEGLETGHEIMLFAPAYYEVRMWTDTYDLVMGALKEKGIIA